MTLLFSEPLPLRTTRDLGDYAVDAPLPHRLGDLTSARFNLVKLTDTEWAVADHAMEVTGVFVDDEQTAGWDRVIQSDGKGRSWTIVRLTAPAPKGAVVSAVGYGKRDDVTGALIENPADILLYIARLAGRTERWDGLRAECAGEGLRMAMSLTEKSAIRAQLTAIVRSAGAIWTPTMGRLYPIATVSGVVFELEHFDVPQLALSATLTDTCDVLRLAYDEEQATGRMQKHMEFTASPQRFGGHVMELTLPLLRWPADAETVGRRQMRRFAGERYIVSAVIARTDVRAGQWIRFIDHPLWPFADDVNPTVMVKDVEVAQNASSTVITGEYIRNAPTVSVTAHSVALPSTTQGAVDVEFKNGIATIRITDADGRPILGARVALDGSAPKVTTADGLVTFVAASGTHTLAIEAPGFTAQELEIDL